VTGLVVVGASVWGEIDGVLDGCSIQQEHEYKMKSWKNILDRNIPKTLDKNLPQALVPLREIM
jgi:hypothetical protein